MARKFFANRGHLRLHGLLPLKDHFLSLHGLLLLERRNIEQRRLVGIQRAALLAPRPEDHLLELRELVLEGLDLVGLRQELSILFLDAVDCRKERLHELLARGFFELFGGRTHDIKDGPNPLIFLGFAGEVVHGGWG